jgi:hypothetical protein
MRLIREIRTAADSVTDGTESVVAAAESLRRGVDVATWAIVLAVVLSSVAIIVALGPDDDRRS